MNQPDDFVNRGDHMIFKANGHVPVRFPARCTPYNGADDQVTPGGEIAGFPAPHSHDLVSTNRAVYYTESDLKADIKAEEKKVRDAENQYMPAAENREMPSKGMNTKTSQRNKNLAG